MRFKQYLSEDATDAAIKIVRSFLGPSAHQVEDFDDSVLDNAKEEQHEFVKTGVGQWVVTVFKTSIGRIAQIVAPQSVKQPVQYFVQKAA